MSDLPAHIVAVATRALHRGRQEWAMAMSAELAQLCAPSARWKFALGCARAALVAPHHPSAPRRSLVAAIVSGLHVLPFMIMEVGNRRNLPEGFPIPLFVFIWLLGFTFVALLMPVLRSLTTGNRAATAAMANPSLLLRGVFLILIAWVWVTLVVDQMPCFLGVPNCD